MPEELTENDLTSDPLFWCSGRTFFLYSPYVCLSSFTPSNVSQREDKGTIVGGSTAKPKAAGMAALKGELDRNTFPAPHRHFSTTWPDLFHQTKTSFNAPACPFSHQ